MSWITINEMLGLAAVDHELVIARKISGGSRSPHGSQTRMGLFSLFGSWAAQGLNPFFQCLASLSQENSLGQV